MAPPHNIVLITSDQHRADTLGCAGHPCVRTPHLDTLAHEGVRFDRAYVDCPICIPARTTLMTGVQAHRYGMPNYRPDYRIDRPRDQFLGSLMTRAGYQTELVGKRHWHVEPSFRGGFEHAADFEVLKDERLRRTGSRGNLAGIGANEFAPTLSPWPPELHETNWAVTQACDFLERRDQTQPFFLWVSVIDPHPPNMIHEPFYSMYDREPIPDPIRPAWCDRPDLPYAMAVHRAGNGHRFQQPGEARKARGVYYGQVTNIDHQLGRLFGTLQALDLWHDTWIVYSSDHGEHLGDYGDYSKSSFLDVSARVPLIVRPPRDRAVRRGVVCEELVQWADLLPTLCDWAGVAAPGDVSGASLTPLCLGEDAGPVRPWLHGQIGHQHMFTDGRTKYLYFADDGAELLFDLDADPREEHDLSDDAGRVAPIRERFKDHLREEGNADLEGGELVNLGKRMTREREHDVSGWLGWGAAKP